MINVAEKPCPFNSRSLELVDQFLSKQQSEEILQELINIDHWNNGQYSAAGRKFLMPRFQTWYADIGIIYNFSYGLHEHRPWTPLLIHLKQQIEYFCKAEFNSVLINLYRNGHDWVDWHSDSEIELGHQPLIASLSLGVGRQFCYRHKASAEIDSLKLDSGSLLIMSPSFQNNWQHCIAREPHIISPRINLTFRYVVMPQLDSSY